MEPGLLGFLKENVIRFLFYLDSQGKNEKPNAGLVSVWGNIIDFSRNKRPW